MSADRDGRPSYLAEIGAAFVVFFIVGGAAAPHVNETHYLTKAKHYWDAAYCPGDFFLDSANPHLAFYWSVGWLTKVCPLATVAWIGRVAAWALLATGWVALWRAAAGSNTRWSAPGVMLSAALFALFTDRYNFAGEWVVGGIEGKSLAYGFFLFGLAAIVRGEWRSPWVWFGAAAAFHVLVGAWAVLVAAMVWLMDGAERAPLRKLVPGLLAGGALSLPGLLPALALQQGVDPAVSAEAARIYTFDRLPHHLAPLSLPTAELREKALRFGALIVAMLGLWYWLVRNEPSRKVCADEPESADCREPLNRLMRFALVCVLADAAALALEAALASSPLTAAKWLRFYWFRQADVVVPATVSVAIALLAARWLTSGSWRRKLLALAPAAWCVWKLIAVAAGRMHDGTPPGIGRMEAPGEWIAACEWAAANTPADAVFLVPRGGQSFKWYASRADVVNWKDVPQDANGVVEWRRRMDRVFPKAAAANESRPSLEGRVPALAREYGASFQITSGDAPVGGVQAYPVDQAAGVYRIFRLDSDRKP